MKNLNGKIVKPPFFKWAFSRWYLWAIFIISLFSSGYDYIFEGYSEFFLIGYALGKFLISLIIVFLIYLLKKEF